MIVQADTAVLIPTSLTNFTWRIWKKGWHNHGIDQAPRWQDTKVSRILERKLTGNDVETAEPITLQYDSQIKPSTFHTSVTKINVRGCQIVQPIQSLLRFLDTAQELGVTLKSLPHL